MDLSEKDQGYLDFACFINPNDNMRLQNKKANKKHRAIQGETKLSFRLIPSLTQSYTKPRTKTVKEEVIVYSRQITTIINCYLTV